MTVNFRTAGAWGVGLGRNLTPAEVDGNHYDHKTRIDDLVANPPEAIGISNITSNGSQLMVYLEDGTSFGPFTLPIAAFRSRGDWAASTAYFTNDVVAVPGTGVYLVISDHTSAGTFDEDAQNSAGDIYQLLVPSNNPAVIRTITAAAYEPAQSDANKYLRCTNSAGCVIELTHGFPVNTEMHFRQCGAGPLAFVVGDTGGIINSVAGKDDGTDHVGAVVTVKCVSADGEWDIFGDLATATS